MMTREEAIAARAEYNKSVYEKYAGAGDDSIVAWTNDDVQEFPVLSEEKEALFAHLETIGFRLRLPYTLDLTKEIMVSISPMGDEELKECSEE